jgi:CPA2 family monovalent cation:H+ antiporter-2
MEVTAPGILDLGLVLLLAAGGGWVARRLTLPAVVGYLIVGIGISPFTPGYVADREQLAFLADVGVVLLLFEVGIEVDLAKIRRDHGAIAWASPLQVMVTFAIGTVALTLAGLVPLGAAFVGLGVAMSSSVVIVNITRSRRRTTDVPTEEALVGWSVLQDVTASSCWPPRAHRTGQCGWRSPAVSGLPRSRLSSPSSCREPCDAWSRKPTSS